MKASIFAAAVLVASSFASAGRFGGHPISGIATSDTGQASGFIQPMTAKYAWDSQQGALVVQVNSAGCCNTFFTGFYLLYGQSLLPFPLALASPPFWADSNLYIFPDDAIGFLPGNMASIPVPPDPALVGQTFFLQALGTWFTTINFSTDYGVSQATKLTFL